MKKQYLNYSGLYLAIYFSFAAITVLLGPYLTDVVGFSGTELGVLSAAGVAVGIFSGPFMGFIYDKTGKNKKVLYIIFLVPILLVSLIPSVKGFLFLTLIYMVIYFFTTPLYPLIDSMTLSSSNPFGYVRAWGAVGYAVGVFLTGLIAEKYGLQFIFYIYSGILLIGLCILFTIKSEKSYQHDGVVHGIKALVTNKPFIGLVISLFFVGGPIVAHNTYFGIYYLELGGTLAGVGIVFLLFAGSEAPVMLFAEKLLTYISVEKLIPITICISIFRFLWYGTGPSTSLIIGTFFLQGLVNGVYLIMVMKYISKIVPVEYRSSGITVYSAITMGLGTVLVQLVGGYILDYLGANYIYIMFGIFDIIGLILYMTFGLYKGVEGGMKK